MHLLVLAAAFTAGVYLGGRVELPAAVVGLFGLAAVLCVAGAVVQRRGVLPAFVVLAVLVGVARTGADGDDAAAAYLAFHGQRGVQIEGVVDGDPEAAGQSLRFPFSVERIAADGASTEQPGRVLVTVSPSVELVRARSTAPIRAGDRLLLSGTIERPPRGTEGFDYPAYLASQGIAAVVSFPEVELLREAEGPGTWLAGARRALARSLDAVVPEPQSAMGQALLLGNRDNLPDDLLEDFRATGASHLLAISGLHMTVVLGIVLAVSSWALGRRRQLYLIPPLAAMWAYALLAGMPPSAERAAIMGTVYLAAFALGRPRSVLPALGLAAAVMVAVDPGVLSAPSFQLSFAAMAGIATLAEPVASRLRPVFGAEVERGDSPRPLVQFAASSAATTVAATVATLPLVAFHFERVSLVGLPATLVTLPVMPLVLMAHGAAGLAGLVSIELAQPFGWVAWITTAYLTGVVGLIARLPGTAFQTGAVAPVLVVAYYVALIGIYLRRPLREVAARVLDGIRGIGPALDHAVSWWMAGPAAAVAALVWAVAFLLPDGDLHVTFADVGQGDMAVVTTPGGRTIVVDGGPSPIVAARAVADELPFWRRHVDLVVLTHPHGDHVSGLTEVLGRYEVVRILEHPVTYESGAYEAWRSAVDMEDAVVTHARAGQSIVTDDGVLIQVLGPSDSLIGGPDPDVDNASVVLRIVYGEVSFLLAADLFAPGERALVAGGSTLVSDVLKVSHHGSRGSSTEGLLAAVRPTAAVVSSGQDNRFGHPHVETMEALGRHVAPGMVFLTSASGSVEFVTDGKRLTVRSDR